MSRSTASLQRLASRRSEAVLQGITSFNIFASMRSVQRFQLATQGLFEGLALGLGRLEIRVRPLYLVLVLVHEGVACIFRHRELGWFSLGFLRTSLVKHIIGGIAGIFRRILHLFFVGPGFAFPVGVRCPLRGDTFLVQGALCDSSVANCVLS